MTVKEKGTKRGRKEKRKKKRESLLINFHKIRALEFSGFAVIVYPRGEFVLVLHT